MNTFVGAFHDAVLLYAFALNETINNGTGNASRNGREVTKRMWNRQFHGVTGSVSIDDNGDRNADYSLLDMNDTSGDFEVCRGIYSAIPPFLASLFFPLTLSSLSFSRKLN